MRKEGAVPVPLQVPLGARHTHTVALFSKVNLRQGS
jgi:hypothetical protein